MWDLFKNNKNYQARKVRNEAERRKKRAEKMGIPKLISDLYHHNIMYYPSWISHSREYVPAIVEKAVKQNDSYKEEKVEIILNNKIYLFGYKEVTMADDYGELELYINNNKVFAVSEDVYEDQYTTKHYPISVNAFVEGDWINDFQELDKQIKILEIKREKEKFENTEEISKLKKDFGL